MVLSRKGLLMSIVDRSDVESKQKFTQPRISGSGWKQMLQRLGVRRLWASWRLCLDCCV